MAHRAWRCRSPPLKGSAPERFERRSRRARLDVGQNGEPSLAPAAPLAACAGRTLGRHVEPYSHTNPSDAVRHHEVTTETIKKFRQLPIFPFRRQNRIGTTARAGAHFARVL
jgi:hypothetical protein